MSLLFLVYIVCLLICSFKISFEIHDYEVLCSFFPPHFPMTEMAVSNSHVSSRNLQKSYLGGVIFGCKNSTIKECLAKQLFGQSFVYPVNLFLAAFQLLVSHLLLVS